ncbi:hypothetical protein [Streptomyces sp. NPDC007369]|uniref:hypothetical protein n=1 Tax=Streptomyces sp. NPDC007369 TaxID=3154589 RepID=UPI003410C4B5
MARSVIGAARERADQIPMAVEDVRKARRIPARVVAVEAVRDGDTVHGSLVNLRAVTDDPAGEKCPATIYRGTAVRAPDCVDAGPLHPSAAAVTPAGADLAAHLGVPFHFAGPDIPDDEAPRRRP